MNEKLAEAAAARKAINQAKRGKKSTRNPTKKNVEETKALAEQLQAENPTTETEITTEVLAESEEAMNELVTLSQEIEQDPQEPSSESIVDVLEEKATEVSTEVENVPTASVDSLELTPNDVALEIEPNCSIDFTNGRSKPAVYVQIGGSYTQEGTYFDKMVREIVYILTLGGKFDRQTAPRFSQRPYIVKMKVPLDKYNDYINRVGYPDYETDGEYYRTSMSAPDFRVLLNFLEQRVSAGWEIDTKQPCMNNSRYVIPFRTRFPVENTAGLHTRVREPIKYTVEELRSFEWDNVKRIAALHGITDTNHNSVISQLKDLFEEVV